MADVLITPASSSIEFKSGSGDVLVGEIDLNGSSLSYSSSRHLFTGSVVATNFTASVFGTASFSNNSISASYAQNIGNGVTSVAGTTNQILVNGGTSAVIGAATISLPDSLAIAALTSSRHIISSGSLFKAITSSAIPSSSYSNAWVRIARFNINERGTIPVGGFMTQLSLKISVNPFSGTGSYNDEFSSGFFTGSNRGNVADVNIINAGFGNFPSFNVTNAFSYGFPICTRLRSAKDPYGPSAWVVDAFFTSQSLNAIDLARVELTAGRGNVQWELSPNSASYTSSVEFDITTPGIRNANTYVYNFDGDVTSSGEFYGNGIGIGTTVLGTDRIRVLGNISASALTGSLLGTASFANSASNAQSSSWANISSYGFLQGGNSFGTTAILGTNDNNNLSFETSGSTRMTVSSNSHVGIGTTNPSARLDVTLSGSIQGTASNAIILNLQKGSGSVQQYYIYGRTHTGTLNYGVISDQNDHLTENLYFGGTARVSLSSFWATFINNSNYSQGGLSIGTSSLSTGYGMYVNNGAISGSTRILANPSATRYIQVGNTGSSAAINTFFVRMDDNNISYMRIQNLDAAATANHGVGIVPNLSNNTGSDVLTAGGIYWLKENVWTSDTTSYDSYLRLDTTQNNTSAEKMRITSDGNVGIGSTTPVAKIDVVTGSAVAAAKYVGLVGIGGAPSTTNPGQLYILGAGSGSSTFPFKFDAVAMDPTGSAKTINGWLKVRVDNISNFTGSGTYFIPIYV